MMNENLIFDSDNYISGSVLFKGEKISFRKYSVVYVEKPVLPEVQTMNIYVREDLAGDHTAPVLFIHRDGGVGQAMPWSFEREYEENHTVWSFKGHTMAGAIGEPKEPESLIAGILKEGFVLASPGVRGRESEADGIFVGREEIPATIIDLKAAVRYLRFNAGRVPGDPEKIISEGASSGGGSSALLGASGNSPLYEKFLKKIGAAEAGDNIYCAVVDSPIHDFEHIDAAYEWQFGPEYVKGLFENDRASMAVSLAAREKYISYVDSLGLEVPCRPEGCETGGLKSGLSLSIRDGSYTEFMLEKLNESLNTYLSGKSDEEKTAWLSAPENEGLGSLKDGRAVIESFGSYIRWNSGRWMKYVGCYDGFDDNPSRENEAFGTEDGENGHFSISMAEAVKEAEGNEALSLAWKEKALENAGRVRLMNPYIFIAGEEKSDIAPVWYLRAGGHHETTGAIFLNLCLLLEKRKDIKLNWRYCWQQNHTSISLKEFDETLPFLKHYCF